MPIKENKLVVGTNNPHKAEEIAEILTGLAVEILLPKDLGITDEPDEDGSTFEENALIKARFHAEKTGLPCLADDSGLVVDALGGRPGVYSSRYAPTSEERIQKLLDELKDVPEEKRSARFVCAAALVVPPPQKQEITVSGSCEGRIIWSTRGEGGFGYDPVFFLPELGKTMAELNSEEKNARSHRGRALAEMRPYLVNLFG